MVTETDIHAERIGQPFATGRVVVIHGEGVQMSEIVLRTAVLKSLPFHSYISYREFLLATEAAPSTLRQPGSRPISDLLHVLMKSLELPVSVKGRLPLRFLGRPLTVESTVTHAEFGGHSYASHKLGSLLRTLPTRGSTGKPFISPAS